MSELRWHIGKEATDHTRLDLPPFRAYLVWLQDGVVVKAEDYSESELAAEVARLQSVREDFTVHKSALDSLRLK